MATDEILRLCEALSLSEDDGPVLDIAEDVQADGIRSVEQCLVGKILSRRKVNREAFRGTIEQIWGTVGQMDIEMVGDNVFVFHFQSLEDKAMVWARGPWHFDKNLIVLEKPVGPGAISELKFKYSEFWIHIYNIPLACMNCKVARLIAEEVGTIVNFPIDSKDLWGKFLRIKVRIDITKPLKRGIRLRLANFDTMITALIKYERLPDFCYGCGFIGHSFRECYNSEVRKNIMEGVEPKFGGWLRASPLDRSKFRQKGEDISDAIPKAQEDIEHVAGVGAEGASRSLSTIPTSSDRRGGKSSRDLGVFEPNRALIAEDGISTQIIQPVNPPSREVLTVVSTEDGHSEALARMDEEIVGSNLCDEGDVVMVGSSCGKRNSKKWKRLIRGSPLQRLIPGCPSPIQKMLLARHYARRDRKPVKRSLSHKFSGTKAGTSFSEVFAIDPGGKRKVVETVGDHLSGKKQKFLESDLSAESAEQARREP
ncbi:hypothetical protein ACOSP7_009251 [Xanthoceras sorbifolium]